MSRRTWRAPAYSCCRLAYASRDDLQTQYGKDQWGIPPVFSRFPHSHSQNRSYACDSHSICYLELGRRSRSASTSISRRGTSATLIHPVGLRPSASCGVSFPAYTSHSTLSIHFSCLRFSANALLSSNRFSSSFGDAVDR